MPVASTRNSTALPGLKDWPVGCLVMRTGLLIVIFASVEVNRPVGPVMSTI